MRKQQTTSDQTTFIRCDDCGRQCRKSAATRYDYTCPAPRTAYVCQRCEQCGTPMTISGAVNSSPWYQVSR